MVVTIPGGSNVAFDDNSNEGLIIKWIPFYGTDLTNNSAGRTTIPSREGEARRSISDSSKLRNIGWQPRISLEAWIARQ